MIKQTTLAIVLRKVNYAGNSGIITAYTEKYGSMSFMLRGLGRKGGKSATTSPLSIVEIVCAYNPSKQLQTISEISIVGSNLGIDSHPYKASVAMFLAEMLSKTLKEESAEPRLFHFLADSIRSFIEHEFSADFHLVFLSRLCRFFGFSPSGTFGPTAPYFDLVHGEFVADKNHSIHTVNQSNSALLGQLFSVGSANSDISWNNHERRELLNLLVLYYSLHMEGMGQIKSLDVLEAVFS